MGLKAKCIIEVVLLTGNSDDVEEFKDWVTSSLQPAGPTFPTSFNRPGCKVLISERA